MINKNIKDSHCLFSALSAFTVPQVPNPNYVFFPPTP